MEAEGTTQVIAEIAVAFIGFAGIVGALARGQLRPDRRHTWLGFWTMIEFGLAMLLAALLPALLYHLGSESTQIWRISSSVFAVFLMAHLSLVTPRYVRARRGVRWPIGIHVLDIALFILLLMAFVSQILNAMGIAFTTPVGGFLIGLYLLLVLSGFNFALLVYLLLLPELEMSPGHSEDASS
jgi:hypothetical protein